MPRGVNSFDFLGIEDVPDLSHKEDNQYRPNENLHEGPQQEDGPIGGRDDRDAGSFQEDIVVEAKPKSRPLPDISGIKDADVPFTGPDYE